MAASFNKVLLALFLLSCCIATVHGFPPMDLTVVNNCPFTVCPGIQGDSGNEALEAGGFCLETLHHRSFPAPDHSWSGRIWARTGCRSGPGGRLSCATGDCAGRLECGGAGGSTPATLAQLSIHHGSDRTSYGVSLVDGFNVGMTVTPHEGRGVCPVVGCRATGLLDTCPPVQQVREGRKVVGCKSGCEAFGTDELCCRNSFNSPRTCKPSSYSEFFKKECPETFTYAHDSPSLTHECYSPKELKIIFCH